MNIFWGMILWIFLEVIIKGVISMHLRVVSKGQELGFIFRVCKFFFLIFIFFFGGGGGGLDIPDNFGE